MYIVSQTRPFCVVCFVFCYFFLCSLIDQKLFSQFRYHGSSHVSIFFSDYNTYTAAQPFVIRFAFKFVLSLDSYDVRSVEDWGSTVADGSHASSLSASRNPVKKDVKPFIATAWPGNSPVWDSQVRNASSESISFSCNDVSIVNNKPIGKKRKKTS